LLGTQFRLSRLTCFTYTCIFMYLIFLFNTIFVHCAGAVCCTILKTRKLNQSSFVVLRRYNSVSVCSYIHLLSTTPTIIIISSLKCATVLLCHIFDDGLKMNKKCARCEKIVYPIEELKCLDKVHLFHTQQPTTCCSSTKSCIHISVQT